MYVRMYIYMYTYVCIYICICIYVLLIGLQLQVVALNALAHLGKSGVGDSYSLGVVAALCESQDAQV